MNNYLSSLFLIAVAACGSAFAQKYLTGELSGSYPAGEYSISGNVHVLPKTTLSFAPGSILRFENFTGIVVRGELVCRGTPQQPVVFTSSRDIPGAKTMPEAFDWNGIKVTPEAKGIRLEYCAVAYSTFGLSIESGSTPVSIRGAVFHHNGSASLTREKKMFAVKENLPVSFTWPEPPAAAPQTENTAAAEPVKKTSAVKTWKNTFGIAGAGIGIAGAALWLTGHLRAEHFNSLMIRPGTPLTTGNDYKDTRDGWVTVRNLGIGLFGLGAAGFAVTFVF